MPGKTNNRALAQRRFGVLHVDARRLKWLLVFGLAAIAGTFVCIYLFYCCPVGSGPAGPTVPRDAFAQSWTTHKVLLLGLGDSITAGFGVAPPHAFFNRLVNNPPDEFEDMRGINLSAALPNLQAINLAVSDSTSSTSLMHLETIREHIVQQPDDVFGLVVMTSGGNDLMHDSGRAPPREGAMYGATLSQAQPWIDNFQKRLHAMIELLQTKFPGGCKIFLADNLTDPNIRGYDAIRRLFLLEISKVFVSENARKLHRPERKREEKAELFFVPHALLDNLFWSAAGADG